MALIPHAPVLFSQGAAKETILTRLAAGAKVTSTAPSSPIYINTAEVKTCADNVSTCTASLKKLFDDYNTARATYKKARSSLGTGLFAWDGAWDMYVAAGTANCTSEDDADKLALPVRTKVRNALAMPLGIEPKYDANTDRLRVRVKRAPGMNVVRCEWTTTPNDPTSWKEFPGCGAIHLLDHPPKGSIALRAASKTAKATSDYTTPVTITIV